MKQSSFFCIHSPLEYKFLTILACLVNFILGATMKMSIRDNYHLKRNKPAIFDSGRHICANTDKNKFLQGMFHLHDNTSGQKYCIPDYWFCLITKLLFCKKKRECICIGQRWMPLETQQTSWCLLIIWFFIILTYIKIWEPTL